MSHYAIRRLSQSCTRLHCALDRYVLRWLKCLVKSDGDDRFSGIDDPIGLSYPSVKEILSSSRATYVRKLTLRGDYRSPNESTDILPGLAELLVNANNMEELE